MKILWLTWKDYTHPEAGGAEVVLRELAQRQVADGHQVSFLTIQHPGSAKSETLDGIDVIRVGTNRYLHPFQALGYYVRKLRNRYDIVIEVVNTAPYFALPFGGRARTYAFYHQLARDIWFIETKPPLSWLGYYLLEPVGTWLLGQAKAPLITISESTKHDLARYGWKPEHTHVISEGIEIEPIKSLAEVKKFSQPTLLALGSQRGMKRSLDQIKAFEIAKKELPSLQLKLAGQASGAYGQKVLKAIEMSPYKNDIEYLGRVSIEEKIRLMQKSHLLLMTSVKEGWGLTVTEANSQGTLAVVYNVDGLRDSVRNNQTGLIAEKNTPEAVADAVVQLLQDKKLYARLQEAAWQWSKKITFDASYRDFTAALSKKRKERS
jgi:glycosyltransferase involved in cell wall biosynthesis